LATAAKITDEQRDQYLKEVESRTAESSEYLLSKMVRYIYGDDPIPEVRHDRRKNGMAGRFKAVASISGCRDNMKIRRKNFRMDRHCPTP